MTDLRERDALLPDRAGPLERAVSKTDGRLDDVTFDQVRRVRSVADAQGAELDHLAAERSVDVYDRAWPEEIRRAVVAAWPHVQAIKGTPHAIETALGAMRITAVLTEWWEASPRGVPYSFEVLALVGARLYAGGPVLDGRTLDAVFATVMRTKAHSRPFDIRIGVRMEATLGLAPAAAGLSRIATVATTVLPIPPAGAVLGFAPAAAGISRIATVVTTVLPIPPAGAVLGFAPAAAGISRIACSAAAVLPVPPAGAGLRLAPAAAARTRVAFSATAG